MIQAPSAKVGGVRKVSSRVPAWYLSRSALCAVAVLVAGCGLGEASLGKQIYEDGIGREGRIAFTQGPDWLRLAGGGCAICHGDRGEGLQVQAGGITGEAPAVTPAALALRDYNQATLRGALVAGVAPDGRELHYYMPRWELSDAEFDALAAYLQSL
jgi:cytochrome c oxidase subunit II